MDMGWYRNELRRHEEHEGGRGTNRIDAEDAEVRGFQKVLYGVWYNFIYQEFN